MATTENQPIRILYADDDADDRDFFHEALGEAHIAAKLTTVKDGNELLKYLAQVDPQPDIIFLDIFMPFKNGKECLKEIRSNSKLSKVPVVIYSTSTYEVLIEETFQCGANLYVSKPTSFQDMVKVLQKIFALNWQEELLKPDKERFLLQTTSSN